MKKEYIPHSCALEIETILRLKGFASEQDANEIEISPIDFISHALLCKGNKETYTIFLNRYEEYQGKRLRDFDEETKKQLVEDVEKYFND